MSITESSETVTRADIVKRMVKEAGASVEHASAVLESVIDTLCNSLKEGRDVKISTFGTFCVNHKNERAGRNPKTGEAAVISARRVVRFRPSSILKKTTSE